MERRLANIYEKEEARKSKTNREEEEDEIPTTARRQSQLDRVSYNSIAKPSPCLDPGWPTMCPIEKVILQLGLLYLML